MNRQKLADPIFTHFTLAFHNESENRNADGQQCISMAYLRRTEIWWALVPEVYEASFCTERAKCIHSCVFSVFYVTLQSNHDRDEAQGRPGSCWALQSTSIVLLSRKTI